MLVYKYTTPENVQKQIAVQVANYPFMEEWKNYLLTVVKNLSNLNFYPSSLVYNAGNIERSDIVDNNLAKLYSTFKFLHDTGLENFTSELDELILLLKKELELNQSYLNKWHRHFTRMEMSHLKIDREDFYSHLDYDQVWRAVQDINLHTHMLELYTYGKLPRREKYKGKIQKSIQHTNASNIKYAPAIHSSENIRWISASFDFFTQEYRYNVWLHEEITGKDQFKTWLDHDDLTQFDCTGNKLMTPSVTFDPYMIFADILDDAEFRAESKQSGKTLNRFPVGNIINIVEIDWEELAKSTITCIQLDGTIVWEK